MTGHETAWDQAIAPVGGRVHAAWCVALAERADLAMTGPQQPAWLDRLEDEQDHLRTALAWALSEAEAEPALRLSGALIQFWQIRGHFAEGLGWLTDALALGGAAALPAHRARVLWGMGFMALMLDDLPGSDRALDQCMVLAHALRDAQLEARILLLSGNGRIFTDPSGALVLLERSARLAGSLGDGWCQALALSLQAHALLVQGDREAALPVITECLTAARANGDLQSLCAGLTVMGEYALGGDDLELALDTIGGSLRVARRLGEPCLLVLALARLGRLSLTLGDLDRAQALLAEALARDGQCEGRRYETAIQSSLAKLAAILQGRAPAGV